MRERTIISDRLSRSLCGLFLHIEAVRSGPPEAWLFGRTSCLSAMPSGGPFACRLRVAQSQGTVRRRTDHLDYK